MLEKHLSLTLLPPFFLSLPPSPSHPFLALSCLSPTKENGCRPGTGDRHMCRPLVFACRFTVYTLCTALDPLPLACLLGPWPLALRMSWTLLQPILQSLSLLSHFLSCPTICLSHDSITGFQNCLHYTHHSRSPERTTWDPTASKSAKGPWNRN